MPRKREEVEGNQDLQKGNVDTYRHNLAVIYKAGVLFMELLDDIESQRGNYHTLGANRLHNKFLLTSNSNGSKFYAGGARTEDLLIELADEYSWHDDSVSEDLQRAVDVFKRKKLTETTK